MSKFLSGSALQLIRTRCNRFLSYFYYVFASVKKKHSCRILSILIPARDNANVEIKFSILFKQIPYTRTPLEIIEAESLLSQFSANEAAMIGLLSAIDLHQDENSRAKQIDKLTALFPKLKEFIQDNENKGTIL